MMKDPSYCYKFYWLEALVQIISEGIRETTFDAVINEMICNAWYSVREFHIHLSGLQLDSQVRDGLEREAVMPKQYDVDHFIPWSLVMNDELWNLMPMDSSLNSAKSNRLPKWDPFFSRFAENQFLLYGFIHEKEGIHKMFEACLRDNLHSIWAGQELYRKGNSREEFYGILQKNMQPVYDSARRQGYEIWNRTA